MTKKIKKLIKRYYKIDGKSYKLMKEAKAPHELEPCIVCSFDPDTCDVIIPKTTAQYPPCIYVVSAHYPKLNRYTTYFKEVKEKL